MEAIEEVQVGLFDDIEDDPAIQTKFADYHRDNPHIFEWFCKFTLEKIGRGSKHVGSKAIVERIRWESPAMANGDAFKINNNFTAYFSRLFMQRYPQHAGIFELRKAKADREGLDA